MDGKVRFFSVLLALVTAFNTVCLAGVTPPTLPDSTNHTRTGEIAMDTEVTVQPNVLSLSWPTNTPFAIDPFDTMNQGQIYSADALIMNYSRCAVQLDGEIYVTANDKDFSNTSSIKYVLYDKASLVNEEDYTNTDNELYIEIACPYRRALNITNPNENDKIYPAVTGAEVLENFTYGGRTVNAYNNSYNVPILSAKANKPTKLSFVLGKPDFVNNAPVQTTESIAAFRYSGTVNPYAEWEKVSDKGENIGEKKSVVRVFTVFSAKPLTLNARNYIEQNYLPHDAYGTIAGLFVEGGIRPSIENGDMEVLLGADEGKAENPVMTVNLGTGDKKAEGIQSIVINGLPSSTSATSTTTVNKTLKEGTDYEFNAETGEVTFNIVSNSWYESRALKLDGNTYTVLVKFNDYDETEAEAYLSFTADSEAPRLENASANVTLASKVGATDGTNASYSIYMGKGTMKATGIASLVIKDMPANDDEEDTSTADRTVSSGAGGYKLSISGTNANLTLDISGAQWYLNKINKIKGQSYPVIITLNDKDNTVIETTVNFSSDAEGPSFESTVNEEVRLGTANSAAEYKINLGKGVLSATGIASITIKDLPSSTAEGDDTKVDKTLTTSEYTFDKTTGSIKLNISTLQWYVERDLKLRDNRYNVVIKLNDKANTELKDAYVMFKSDAAAPSFESTVNEEVRLGVTTGALAEYKINLGKGILGATGIASIIIKDLPSSTLEGNDAKVDRTLTTSEYTFDKTTGSIKLNINNLQWYTERDLKLRDNRYNIVIKLNDKANTELKDAYVTFKSDAAAPSFGSVVNAEVLLASAAGASDGTNAEYIIDLGAGALGATGITSVIIKDLPSSALQDNDTKADRTLTASEYAFDKATGLLKLNISNIQWYLDRDLKLRNNRYDVVIKLNDKANTELKDAYVTFKSDATAPSFESIINKDVILASSIGGKDGKDAQYKINLGKGSLAAKGVSKVVIKGLPDESEPDKVLTAGSDYTFNAATGELTLSISGNTWYLINGVELNKNTYKVAITMNDTAKTELPETEVTFTSDAKRPSLVEEVNTELKLASRAGATDGENAEYRIDMGEGALAATGISKVVIKNMPANATVGDASTADRIVVAGVGGYSYNSAENILSLDISGVSWYISRAAKINNQTYPVEITLNDVNSTVIKTEVKFLNDENDPSLTPIDPNVALSTTTSSNDGSAATFTLDLGRGVNGASGIKSVIIQKLPSMTSLTNKTTTNKTVAEGVSGYTYNADTKLFTINVQNTDWYISRTPKIVDKTFTMVVTLSNGRVFNTPITFSSAAGKPEITSGTANVKLASTVGGTNGTNGTLTLSLGSGKLAATGISSVTMKGMPANTTAGDTSTADKVLVSSTTGYKFDATKKTITLYISGVDWFVNRKDKIVGNEYTIQIKMNDPLSTVLEGKVRFS